MDDYEALKNFLDEELLYYRHYIGKIVDTQDELNFGRVKISIEELGMDTPALGIWCSPRQGHSMSIPKVGDYAEVYFINAERGRPVYLFPASEINFNCPTTYKGDIAKSIIFESKDTSKDNITYKEGKLTLLSGEESFVLGDSQKEQLQKNIDALTQLQSDFNNWTPVPEDGGQALKSLLSSGFLTNTIANLTNTLSEVIKGK
jgi:hypothetical protein